MNIEKLKNDIENIWTKKDTIGKSVSKKDLKAEWDFLRPCKVISTFKSFLEARPKLVRNSG